MSAPHNALGAAGEAAAERFLRAQRYTILERNYSCPLGEVDLIGLDGGTLAFIEVKTRSDNQFGSPFDAVESHKQRRMERAAQHYLTRHRLHDRDARFDVVGVWWNGDTLQCELIRNAFEPRRW